MERDYPHQHFPTSEELVRELVWVNNGYHLPKGAVFGPPNAFTPLPRDPRQNDTWVEVKIPKHWWQRDRGAVKLFYKRYNLNSMRPEEGAIWTPPAVPFTVYGILPQINLYYGVNLDQNDVLDATFTTTSGPYPLVAAPGSLAWQGVGYIPIPLPNVVTVTDLAGFLQYEPA